MPSPFSSLVIFIVPLFKTFPVEPIFSEPSLFVIVKFPLGFDTSPFILIPFAPLFVIVILPFCA